MNTKPWAMGRARVGMGGEGLAGVMIRLAKNCVIVGFSMCNFWVKCVLPTPQTIANL